MKWVLYGLGAVVLAIIFILSCRLRAERKKKQKWKEAAFLTNEGNDPDDGYWDDILLGSEDA